MPASKMKRRRALLLTLCCTGTALAGYSMYRVFRHPGTSPIPAKPKFRLQSPWINDAEFIGYFVALEHRWYKDEGIEFEYLPGGPEVLVEGTLLSGQAELALAPVETVAKLVQKRNAPFVIVGTQYQKSPLGIVSLSKTPVRSPSELVGKRLAVPVANIISVEALLRLNGIDKSQVKIVPYQYDPTPLINGEVDATVDFVTNVPYTIKSKGHDAVSFLLFDHGFKVYNDVVVVTRDVLAQRREDVKAWIRASRRGWVENFKDPEKYPRSFMQTWYSKTGRTVDSEIFFNKAQRPFVEHSDGVFAMTQSAITANISTLAEVGIKVPASLFDTSLLSELGA